jgi:hypothetical protein
MTQNHKGFDAYCLYVTKAHDILEDRIKELYNYLKNKCTTDLEKDTIFFYYIKRFTKTNQIQYLVYYINDNFEDKYKEYIIKGLSLTEDDIYKEYIDYNKDEAVLDYGKRIFTNYTFEPRVVEFVDWIKYYYGKKNIEKIIYNLTI